MRRAAASRVFADNDKYTSVRHGNNSTSHAAAAAVAVVALSVMAGGWLEEVKYLLPTSWFYEAFMPVLSELSLRIRCSSYLLL